VDPVLYSQRLLNPFRGIMNVVEMPDADAVTIDASHWDLYVGDTELSQDYIFWQAPWLLLLPLADETRAWLENAACKRVVTLAGQYIVSIPRCSAG
jgi:hypothetical protein